MLVTMENSLVSRNFKFKRTFTLLGPLFTIRSSFHIFVLVCFFMVKILMVTSILISDFLYTDKRLKFVNFTFFVEIMEATFDFLKRIMS